MLVPLSVVIFLYAVAVISNAERNLAFSLHLVRFLLVPRRNDAPKSISTAIRFRELKALLGNFVNLIGISQIKIDKVDACFCSFV